MSQPFFLKIRKYDHRIKLSETHWSRTFGLLCDMYPCDMYFFVCDIMEPQTHTTHHTPHTTHHTPHTTHHIRRYFSFSVIEKIAPETCTVWGKQAIIFKYLKYVIMIFKIWWFLYFRKLKTKHNYKNWKQFLSAQAIFKKRKSVQLYISKIRYYDL